MLKVKTNNLSAWQAFKADVTRYLNPNWPMIHKLRCILETEEIWILGLFRWGSWIYQECPSLIAPFVKLIWKPLNAILTTVLDTHLTIGARIGPGLYIGHHGGIWVNPAAQIGADCNIGQGVVIGMAGVRDSSQAPIIGNRVWVGPHAIITGPVHIENDCVIGSNSLVVADVPEKGLVIGVPAKLTSYSGSGRLIRYPSSIK